MIAFNRTSMESKLILKCCQSKSSGLLIEPVWNRNLASANAAPKLSMLLIEPVWNRNRIRFIGRLQLRLTFNRTSMESKHGWGESECSDY